MLSTTSRPYIDASVPVLREHGLAITRHFYDGLFTAHPELRHTFNMANQANGLQQQSLAAAVFAYAANIDNPAALAPVIGRIVHKHASVGVTAAHYPIVGRHLLGAIQAVLGDAATPELIAAWDEAYGLLANTLIEAEAALHADKGSQPGELITVSVKAVRQESDEVISYYLEAPGGGSPGAFLPGQYTSVAAQLGESGELSELRQLRQYSLSDAPHQPWWRISVKREDAWGELPAGQMSQHLHAQLRPGDKLQVSPAFGDFAPKLDQPRGIALISAGIGITPMVSVLNALITTNPQRPVLFAHAARDGAHHALKADLITAQAQHPQLRTVVCYESPQATDTQGIDFQASGRLDLAQVLRPEDLDSEFYLCGPIGFMQAQWHALLKAGVSAARIHREVFGPELLDHLL